MRLALRRRLLVAPALAAALATPRAGAQAPAAAPGSTIVLLVRHAEKADEPGNDPTLSAAGAERARALAEALRDAGVTSIITTQYKRTRLTAQPLAERLGLTAEVVAAGGGGGGQPHEQAVAAAVRRRAPGEVVLVVGHSNTVPNIIAALGGPAMPQICDSEYANLFMLVLPGAVPDGQGAAATGAGAPHRGPGARLVRTRFGAADPAGEGCATPAMR